MSRFNERELLRNLAAEPVEPPAELLEKLRQDIPPDLAARVRLGSDASEPRPGRWLSAATRWRVAAAVLLLVGGGWLVFRGGPELPAPDAAAPAETAAPAEATAPAETTAQTEAAAGEPGKEQLFDRVALEPAPAPAVKGERARAEDGGRQAPPAPPRPAQQPAPVSAPAAPAASAMPEAARSLSKTRPGEAVEGALGAAESEERAARDAPDGTAPGVAYPRPDDEAAWLVVDAEALRGVDRDCCIYWQLPGGVPPKVLERPEPVVEAGHPALASGAQVIARAIVSPQGRIAEVQILKGPDDPEMRRAVIEALAAWRLEPARLAGEPVAVYYHLTLNPRAP